jgi:hypothetical protein
MPGACPIFGPPLRESFAGCLAVNPCLVGQLLQLAMDVQPLPHAVERQEVLAARFPQLVAGQLGPQFVVEIPQFQKGQEVRRGIGQPGMRLVGRLLLVVRAVARILDFEHRGDDQHLGQAAFLRGRQDHASDPRIDGQPSKLPPQIGQFAALVERAQFEQRLVAVADRVGARRIEERKILQFAQPHGLGLQDHRGQIRAADFGQRVAVPGLVVRFAVQPHADPRPDASAAPGPLVGRRARNRLDRQSLDFAARRVVADPRCARIDHKADAGHGQRRLGDVGGQHDPAPRVSLKHLVLVPRRESRVQGQDLRLAAVAGDRVAAQRLVRFQNVAFGRQENQNIAGSGASQFVHGLQNRVLQIHIVALRVLGLQRPVQDIDRIGPPRHLDDRRGNTRRRVGEVLAEPGRVDRGRGDDQLQVAPTGQQALEVAEQEVDVQRPLVRLVDDDRVVLVQEPFALRFRQQDAVGHQLDVRLRLRRVGEADLETDVAAQRRIEFLGNPRGHRAGGDPPRLGMTDQSVDAAPQPQADFRQLGALAGARFAADDGHRMLADRGRNLVDAGRDRQLGIERQRRHVLIPALAQRDRTVELLAEPRQRTVERLATFGSVFHRAQLLAQTMAVGGHRPIDLLSDFGQRQDHRTGFPKNGRCGKLL